LFVPEFLSRVEAIHKTGNATEHSYRSALEWLFAQAADDIVALNEPKAVKIGRPDFVINRGEITIGHCEAKDIGLDINPEAMNDANRQQFDRYRKALPNLVYTNCLDFRFYKEGELVREISIADYLMGIQPKSDNFEALENQLRDFSAEQLQTITSSKRLAEMMAGKAVLIKDILGNALKEDKDLQTELAGQHQAFRDQLIHDLTSDEFADIYAETVAYGMFAARLHDDTKEDFSREEALELLPKSNPFLRNLFGYVAGPSLDERIRRTIDELADIFQATDLPKLFADFGKFTQRNDPFLHFYETFLAEYNPKKRKARGIWYTPEPVVNFIVRAVDDVLKTDFGLHDGLADSSKVTVDWETGQTDKKGNPISIKKDLHKVQILDPATGTGTFLAEVIKQIAPRIKGVAEGMWSSYIETDLIPRLHGLELLMASYAMCHMKLDMMLSELGYKPSGSPPRLSVYLTNSLEEGEAANQTLPFAQWLSNEVREANTIKRDMPIMCVIGNPPYSGESANKGEWIMGLMEAYKKEPGGKQNLDEKNPKWINDDYVKFIRFAEHMIEKNGEGVVGFITNHGYLDNPTFRGMRWHLLKSFQKIYVLNLHGNTNKKERIPEGCSDKNVFDIKAGVAIVICVKTQSSSKKENELAQVLYSDLWGSRAEKTEALWENGLGKADLEHLVNSEPHYMFVPWDYETEAEFRKGFSLGEFMPVHSISVVTGSDKKFISSAKSPDFDKLEEDLAIFNSSLIHDLSYRPFENSRIYYDQDLLERSRFEIMRHYLGSENLGLLASKAHCDREFRHCFVTQNISEAIFLSGTTGSNAMNFPLFLPESADMVSGKRVNFEKGILEKILTRVQADEFPIPDEYQIFDYIYGCLHNEQYRSRFWQALSIEYPHIPYPSSPTVFWDVSQNGNLLRRLHLMDDTVIGETPYPFSGEGGQPLARSNSNLSLEPKKAVLPVACLLMMRNASRPFQRSLGISTSAVTSLRRNG